MRTARDRLETILQRLADRRGDERVFTRLYEAEARAAADAADARRRAGLPLGPLDGAIVSIKDLFDVKGEPTLAGSLLRRGAESAPRDALVVARLRRAGAVILGKTAMTDFAFTAVGFNPHALGPGNAADPARIPGGSSSGAGVSVAESTSEIAIGSDTGGSVRIPAALNGVAGFKPTARRVPLEGAFPLSPTLDSIGPLARTIAECAAADAVMAGTAPDPLPAIPLPRLRIGIPRGRLLGETEAVVETAFHQAVEALRRAGARFADCSIDGLLADMAEATQRGSIASLEGARVHANWLNTSAAAGVDPRVSRTLARRAALPAAVLTETLARRTALVAAMDARLEPFDALALPTVPLVAPPIADLAADASLYDRVEGLLLRNTQVANQFDLCAVSLPLPGMNLPAGLMLIARHGGDRQLLAIAAAVEALLGR